jgi:hypothetical protein
MTPLLVGRIAMATIVKHTAQEREEQIGAQNMELVLQLMVSLQIKRAARVEGARLLKCPLFLMSYGSSIVTRLTPAIPSRLTMVMPVSQKAAIDATSMWSTRLMCRA